LEGIVERIRRFRPDYREDEIRKHLEILERKIDNMNS